MVVGLLERPPLSAHIEEVHYKIFVSGKSGVGKSCTVAKLTGHDIPKSHIETAGNFFITDLEFSDVLKCIWFF